MGKRKTRTRTTRKMGKLDHNHKRVQTTPHNEHKQGQRWDFSHGAPKALGCPSTIMTFFFLDQHSKELCRKCSFAPLILRVNKNIQIQNATKTGLNFVFFSFCIFYWLT
jgi:hypothetical protein